MVWLRFRLESFFEFFDDLEHTIAAHNRVIHQEFECRSIFEYHGASNETLNAFAMACQQAKSAFLLLGRAQDADEDDGRVQIARDINVVHGDQAGLADGELAADSFADLALE